MTDKFLPAAGRNTAAEAADAPGTADVVKDQASDLSRGGVQAGKHVAGVAREKASGVAAEAGRQGEDLLRQAQGQLAEQAARVQKQLANRLFSLSDELYSMAGASGQRGVAAGVASQAASRVRAAGQWLEERKPGQVADDVQSFARSPAGFMAQITPGGPSIRRAEAADQW